MHLREISETNQALGGEVKLTIVTDIAPYEADIIFTDLWRQVYIFERQFSRFLPMSELSVFNRTSGIQSFITPEFKDLLVKAKTMGVNTAGLYNPFILPALQRAGYVKSAVVGYENDVQEDHSKKKVVSVEHLIIGDAWASMPYGTALDMGGCGKGYLADQLGNSLKNLPVQGYWLSLGGDVAAGGFDENGKNITLNIQNANNLDGVTGWTIECPLAHSAVATSGTFRKAGQDTKKDWHHIIDPITLEPAVTDIRLATVCANTALESDVLASCAIILGSRKAPAFLKKHGVTAALLQCIDHSGKPFEKKFGQCIKKSLSSQTVGALLDV